jgi:hypothetical protein
MQRISLAAQEEEDCLGRVTENVSLGHKKHTLKYNYNKHTPHYSNPNDGN